MEYSSRQNYVNIREASVRYEISRAKLHRMIRMGRLAPIKDSRDERATLLRIEDLEHIFRFPRETVVDAQQRSVAAASVIPAHGVLTSQKRARIDALRYRIAGVGRRFDDSVDLVREQRGQRSVELAGDLDGGHDSRPGRYQT